MTPTRDTPEGSPLGSSWRRWRDAALRSPASPSDDRPAPAGSHDVGADVPRPSDAPSADEYQADDRGADAPDTDDHRAAEYQTGERATDERATEERATGEPDTTDERATEERAAGEPDADGGTATEERATGEPDADGGTAGAGAPTHQDDEPTVGWAVAAGDHEWIDAHVLDDEGERSDALPAVPLLPAMAGRLESLHGALATMAMRIDAVAATMGSFRSALGDRVDDYAETVGRLQRNATAELDEARRGTERLIAELRRGVGDNDTALRRVAGRVDDVAAEVGVLSELMRRADGERDPDPATQLGQDLAQLRAELGRLVGRRDLDDLRAAVEAVRADGVRSNVVVVELLDGIDALRVDLEAVRDAVAVTAAGPAGGDEDGAADEPDGDGEVEPAADREAELRAAMQEVVREEVEALAGRVDAGLGAARSELHLLKRRIGVQAKAPLALDADQLAAIAAAVAEHLEATVLDAVAERVVERLERHFEMVGADAPPPPPAPAAVKPLRRNR